jgi:metal-responsive CopG/Arc/MetJ family transcriptional regulator
MANSKAISIRIPDELLEKIDRLAEEKYKSHKGTPNRSLVVLDAIVDYFDTLSDTGNSKDIISVSDSVSIVEFNELREEFGILKDSVKYLIEKMSTLTDTVDKTDTKQPERSQLSIIVVSDNVSEIEKGLTPVELAERLGKKPGDVTSKKAKVKDAPEKFSEWAKKLDPEGWGWEFRESEGKRVKYFPIKPLA